MWCDVREVEHLLYASVCELWNCGMFYMWIYNFWNYTGYKNFSNVLVAGKTVGFSPWFLVFFVILIHLECLICMSLVLGVFVCISCFVYTLDSLKFLSSHVFSGLGPYRLILYFNKLWISISKLIILSRFISEPNRSVT